jgi:hypothetical protein
MRGDAIRVAAGCPFDSIDTISFSNMMNREEFTPGIWGVTCIKLSLSLMLHRLKSYE